MRNYYLLLWVLLFVEGVSGDGKDEMEMSVTKEDSITLPGFPGVQKTDQIVWKFGDEVILQVEEAENVFKKSEDERFEDRLDLNKTTGALTITQVTPKHAGRYQLDINNKANPRSKIFRITVHDMEAMSKMEGDSFSLNIDIKVQKNDLIVWKFGDQDLNNRDGRWSNVHLNDQTGELQFRRIQRNQSGLYEVKINTSSLILHRKFSVTVDRSGAVSGISGASVGLMVWAVAVLLLQV